MSFSHNQEGIAGKVSSFSWRAVALAWAFAVAPTSLFAVDGVIVIDQSHALAGGITPGDAAGFPVTISQPGSYRLSSNLTVPDMNTTAVVITADGVTLDLNGFSIMGPVVCTEFPLSCPAAGSGIGVQAPSGAGGAAAPRGTKILNGSVRGMGSHGIFLQGEGTIVDKVNVASNAGNGIFVGGEVTNCTATENGMLGIFGLIVRGSIAFSNVGDGITIDASGGVAIGNVSSFNGGRGMNVPNGSVTGNSLVKNGGVQLQAVCPSSIIGNMLVSSDATPTIQTTQNGCVMANNSSRP
jgi:hypothetical protein